MLQAMGDDARTHAAAAASKMSGGGSKFEIGGGSLFSFSTAWQFKAAPKSGRAERKSSLPTTPVVKTGIFLPLAFGFLALNWTAEL